MSAQGPFSADAATGVWKRAVKLPKAIARQFARAADYSPPHSKLLPGNDLELLIDGRQTFDRMLKTIADAQRYIHLETYIWEPDSVGSKFADALCRKAQAGVRTRVIVDGIGGASLPWDFLERLKDSRVEVVVYRPLSGVANWNRLRHIHRRDHRKIIVIDGRLSFCGGINLCENNAAVEDGGAGWRDTHVVMRGPVTAQLDDLFRETWHACGGRSYGRYPAVSFDSVASTPVLAAALKSDHAGQRTTIRRHYIHAIDRARERIYIANAYFVPSRQMTRSLCRAGRRGVEVRLLLPNLEHNDVALVQLASQHVYEELMRAGVHVHWWPISHMHAKTAVIDGVWSIVGSYNLDSVSLFQNLEVVIEVFGESFGSRMDEMFRADFDRSVQLDLSFWKQRGLATKLSERFAYRLRRFL